MQAELDDAVLWVKVLIAIITGVCWGYCMEGFPALAGGVMVVASFTTAFIRGYLGLDEADYGGQGAVMFEGLLPATATFLVRVLLVQMHGRS